MSTVTVNFNNIVGKIKPMHATNNGPASKAGSKRGNFETFSAAGIPYVRNHDASLSEAYGSQHVVDVHCIFPDFTRDVNDETAYDFALTDAYTKNIIDTGAKVFYRLGASIEHWPRKYGTKVPADYLKWAKICENIIRHYNEGWANGFNYNIEYWEIWNEPDLDDESAQNKRTWGGTKAEFFDFYETASKHLRSKFPTLKFGGPALAFRVDWAEDFLREMQKRQVTIDFYSWHMYCYEPERIVKTAEYMNDLLKKYGYQNAESILNEWNYVRDWADPLDYISVIKGIKGAAFCAAVMCAAQNYDNLDTLMYYDARVEKTWNGMFSSDTLLPLKGYYPFKMFNELYMLGNACECNSDDRSIYVSAANDKNGTNAVLMSYYTADDCLAEKKEIQLNFGEENSKYDMLLLDTNHDSEIVATVQSGDVVSLLSNSVCLFIKKQ